MRIPGTAPLLLLIWLGAHASAWGQTCPGPQPEVEPNDSPAQATPLQRPSPAVFTDVFLPAPGRTTPGDVDYFSVALQAGTRLWLLVDTGMAQAPGATRDSVLQVLRPDVTLLEDDDDDGTGMASFVVTTTESSTIAGLLVPATGTYFIRVAAKNPAAPMEYRLLLAVTPGTSDNEVEPNDTPGQAFQPSFTPVIFGTLTPGDVDCYRATILDHGVPWVIADGWPETDPFPVDLSMNLDLIGLGPVIVNSSQSAGRPAESVMAYILTNVCLTGSSLAPGNRTYRIGIFYSSECPLPVGLQSFSVE